MDWLEASYFYYRPSDLLWINGKPGNELDKGFNVKFSYKNNNKYFPNIAIGLDDFAGTGYFSREYIVSTMKYKNMNITSGLGWGKFVGQSEIENPLNFISDKLNFRPEKEYSRDFGGTPTYNQWFRGSATYFGGIEFLIPKAGGVKIKMEYDPYDYFDFSGLNRSDASFKKRKKSSNFNFGISYPYNKFLDIDASLIKGNSFNLSFTFAITFNQKFSSKPKFNPVIEKKSTEKGNKIFFYEDLLHNLNSNRLLLQTADLKDEKLNVAISTSDHRNSIRSSSYAAYISNEVAKLNNLELDSIDITHINAGIELNRISYFSNYLEDTEVLPIELKIKNTQLDSGNPNNYQSNEFKPNVNFPVVFSQFQPALKNHIGAPEKFYFGGIYLKNISEIQFNRNLIMSSELDYSLYNNFRETITGPASRLPHVRTDVMEYLEKEGILISRLQIDYLWSPRKDYYAKLSGGIFESMYGGFGTQFIYKPFKKNYAISMDAFYVKRRDFDQRFKFLDYKTITGHLNFTYHFPFGIESNLSFGKYLAKDIGYTLDLARTTRSGFKAGIYFTRTDVPKELFGEGSFDKGFYFQIPLDLFNNNYQNNYTTFKLSPLTRDGGAKLIYDKDLRGMIYNSSHRELINQWDGFLN